MPQPIAKGKIVDQRFEAIFQPITLNQVTIANRLVSTPHSELYAESGKTTERYIRYHEEKARGGIGLTMGGASSVSLDSPQLWGPSVDVTADAIIPHFQNLAVAVHGHGAAVMIQLTHLGRRSRWDRGFWPHLVSPSGVREPLTRGTAKVIELEDIKRIQHDFAQAARRVKEGGLDGAEISAVHQHLIDQFWSPRTNKRSDGYGGSLENRMRFGLEVFEAVRAEVGSEFCIGLRMCGDEFHEDGLREDDLKQIAERYDGSGLVDFISVIGSGADTLMSVANSVPNMAYPPHPYAHLAAGIKRVVDVPVMHAQNIRDPAEAARLLEDGAIDMVGMTRAHIADPHIVNKVREGRVAQIRPCVGANYCIDREYNGLEVLCLHNAATGRESTMPHSIEKGDIRRRVVVIGGGPAGMEAARVSAERGHDVILFERSADLGGRINLAALAPARDQMSGIVRWLQTELARLAVDVRLNVEADAETIRLSKPEIVVVATGGRPNLDENKTWGHADGSAISVEDVLSSSIMPGATVLIYDAIGGFAGTTCADFLAEAGSVVELVTPDPSIGQELGDGSLPVYLRRLFSKKVTMTPGLGLERVERKDGRLLATLKNQFTEGAETRVVDQVVIDNGTVPNDQLYGALKSEAQNGGVTDLAALFAERSQPHLADNSPGFLLYRIGDCVSMHGIHAAIYDALRLCKHF
jgi:2,4-dienoyl-CoA reductase-like NADH-dependent reductase (Old Yellow Enzyme family)/thioredoxin reductase